MNTPLPFPFIAIHGVPNFRDCGSGRGRVGDKDVSVRTGYIYRSGQLSTITFEGKSKISELGIKYIYDLRSPEEVQKDTEEAFSIPGTTRISAPVFVKQPFSPEEIAIRLRPYLNGDPQGFVEAYKTILESAMSSFTEVFRHIRDRKSEPLLFHCSAGKDRTGVLAALILSLAGVSHEDIAKEYSLTEMGLADWKKEAIGHVQNKLATYATEEEVDRMLGAREESMKATLNCISDTYDGVEGYLKSKCGFTEDDIEIMRKNLVAV